MEKKYINITKKGYDLIKKADEQGGIYPNNIAVLSILRDGEWYEVNKVRDTIKAVDWDECLEWLLRNGHIIETDR